MVDFLKLIKEFDNLKPVFIGGFHRSGTTLMLRLLEAHPDCLTYPFENAFLYAYQRFSAEQKKNFMQRFQSRSGGEIFDFLKEAAIDSRTKERDAYLDSELPSERNSASEAIVLKDIFDEELKELFQECFAARRRSIDPSEILKVWLIAYFVRTGVTGFSGFKNWVLKYPDRGDCYEIYRKYFPESEIIYMVREPSGCYASIKEKNLYRKRRFRLGQFIKEYWQAQRKIQKAVSEDGKVLRVCYEDLVLSPEESVKRVGEFLGIPFRPESVKPVFLNKSWEANSNYRSRPGERDRIDAISLKRWKETLAWHEKFFLKFFLTPRRFFAG